MGMAEYPEIGLLTLDEIVEIGGIGRRKKIEGIFSVDAFEERRVMGDDNDLLVG